MEKKNSMMLIIITIAAFIGVTALATFAYFATNTRIDANIGVNVETAGASYTFTASGSGEINMPISATDMAEANVSTEYIKNGTGNINVTLASPSNDIATVCTYDIIWVWDSEDKYTTPDGTLPITQDGKTYPYEFSTKVDNAAEKDISMLEAGTTANSVVMQKCASITSASTTATSQTHTIETKIYNLPVDQENLKSKNFKAHMTIENVNCTMQDINSLKTLAAYVANDVYNSSSNQASITASTKGAGLYKHDATLANGAGDNSYRYAGADADVNNYVCFVGDDCTNENNLYRIISVDSNNVTKIIKATSLGSKNWNEKVGYTAGTSEEDTAMGLTSGTSYTNIWAIKQADGSYYTSSLNDYLNGEYLTSLGTKADKIEMTTWNVGGASYSNDLSKRNVHDFMTYELDMAADDTNKGTYQAKVGLMYAYEYGYAALPEFWGNKLYYNNTDGYNLSLGKDWMLSENYPWTISRNSDSSNFAFGVLSSGGHVVSHGVALGYAVRPVLGLSSSVKLINAEAEGVGTKANPMRII